MSGEAQKKISPEAELEENLNTDLEAAQDEVFGSETEIAAKAAEAEGTQTPEETEAQLKAEQEAKAKDDEGKTPEDIAKEDAEKKEASDKAAAGKEKEKEKEASEKEEDPYEVPEELKGRTRERFETLTGHLKEANEKTEKQEGIIQGFRGVLEQTGMDPTELQRTLDLGAMMKSNPEKALEALTGVVADLSAQLGVVQPGSDVFEGQDDLKQKVADRELTVEDATLVAKARIAESARVRNNELQNKEKLQRQALEENSQAFNQSVTAAKSEVGTFLETLGSDPDAEKVAPYLIEAAKFAAENLAPEKWKAYISNEHKKLKDLASAMGPKGRTDTPIMDDVTPPGGDKDPQDLDQLADQML